MSVLPALATAADFEEVKGPAPAGVQVLIDQAAARIRRHCGWHVVGEVTETVVLNGTPAADLYLPTLHLTAVDAVSLGSGAWPVLVEPVGFEWSAAGYLRRPGGWGCQLRGVHVTMTHGYDPDECPEVVGLALDLAARAAASPSGFIREQVGAVALAPTLVAPNAAGGIVLMEHEKELLAPYRLGSRA